jgi:hypothetical protein
MQNELQIDVALTPILERLEEMRDLKESLKTIEDAVARIDRGLDRGDRAPQRWFKVKEVAATLNRDEFTVREWCRLGRIVAKNRGEKRGRHFTWPVAANELERYRNEGLLPVDPNRNRKAS